MALLLLGALLSPAVTPARQMQKNQQMRLAQEPTAQLTELKHPRGLTSSFPGAAGDAEPGISALRRSLASSVATDHY